MRVSFSAHRAKLTLDYDEGAADALMFLHSDRRAPSVPVQQAPSDRSPPNSVAGTKRTSPPSPELSRPGADSKKSRGSPFANSPTKRQTVIEVLNAPREVPSVREREREMHSGPRIEVLNKPHERPLHSPRAPRSPEINVRPASKPPSPTSLHERSEQPSAERGSAKPTTPPVALASTPAPTSDTRTSPVAVRSPIATRSPEISSAKPKSPLQDKRSPGSPKAPLSGSRDKPPNNEDVEMADADKDN